MPVTPCDARTAARPPASLRVNFAATFAGNALFAASQWAVLSLIAKLGGNEMLGQYALAVAVATPISLFSHLNLRAVLATDVGHTHPFGDYLAVRLATTGLGVAAIAAVALGCSYAWPAPAAIVLLGLTLGLDNLSDIYYGLMQRRERMDQIAWSMMARGLLSMAALGAMLWRTGSLLAAVGALAVGRLAVLLFYDRPVATRGESLARTGWKTQAGIFRLALPLGVVLMLASLSANLPRYAIEARLGTAALGWFAAVASFMTVGSTVINALGQAATPRLARCFSSGDRRSFTRLAWRLCALACLLGAAGVAVALAIGGPVLALVYRPAYSAHAGLLVWAMAAGVAAYVAGMLGYVITAARAFAAQAPLLVVVAGASGIASWLLVPRMGLQGAVVALAAAAVTQIAGEVLILRGALRRRESAA